MDPLVITPAQLSTLPAHRFDTAPRVLGYTWHQERGDRLWVCRWGRTSWGTLRGTVRRAVLIPPDSTLVRAGRVWEGWRHDAPGRLFLGTSPQSVASALWRAHAGG